MPAADRSAAARTAGGSRPRETRGRHGGTRRRSRRAPRTARVHRPVTRRAHTARLESRAWSWSMPVIARTRQSVFQLHQALANTCLHGAERQFQPFGDVDVRQPLVKRRARSRRVAGRTVRQRRRESGPPDWTPPAVRPRARSCPARQSLSHRSAAGCGRARRLRTRSIARLRVRFISQATTLPGWTRNATPGATLAKRHPGRRPRRRRCRGGCGVRGSTGGRPYRS